MLTFGVTGNRRQNGLSLSQAKALLKRFGGVFTGTLLGRKWAQNRFRFPTCASPVAGGLRRGHPGDRHRLEQRRRPAAEDVEASLQTAWPPRAKVHMFTHLSHVYGEGSSIYTTYVFRPAASYAATLERWKRLKHAAQPGDRRQSWHHQPPAWRRQDHAPYLPREGELGVAALRAMAGHSDPAGRLNRGTLLRD